MLILFCDFCDECVFDPPILPPDLLGWSCTRTRHKCPACTRKADRLVYGKGRRGEKPADKKIVHDGKTS